MSQQLETTSEEIFQDAPKRESYIVGFDLLEQCSGHTVALDTETTGLEWWDKKLIGVGFYCEQLNIGGYVPTLDTESRQTAKKIIADFSEETIMIFHNAKFDMHFLSLDPFSKDWTILDTTVMIHLLDSRYPKALKYAEEQFLGSSSKRAHLDSAPVRSKIWDWPLRLVSAYCANDCIVTYQLAQKLYPIMVNEWGLEELFLKDMKYMKVLYRMEHTGVILDETFAYRSSDVLADHLKILEQELFDRSGQTFNWRSPQQLSRAIYDGLGIPKPKNPFAGADGIDRSRFADAGKYKSTCTATFILTEKIHHPLGELISSIREIDKLRKNYLKWLELQDDNHILHTTFNQTGTRTGRLSSSRPNLQNIASNTRGRFTQSVYTGSLTRSDEFNMRRAIIPRPGRVFLSIDYKQMEMRMFGILSKDPFMLKALIAGKDVHLEIALKVWGDCGYEVNMVHREWSKTISFGLIYGMTLGSLMYKLDMNRMQAARVTDQYWGQFPRIKPWMNEIIASCKLNGYLRYWSGRLWKEGNPIDMYKGCNALIQGGCADLLSIASIRLHEYCISMGYNLVNLVHDESITEIPEEDILKASRGVSSIMQVPDLLDIPFATDCKVGPSYGDMPKIPKEMVADLSFSSVTMQKLHELEDAKKEVVSVAEIPDDDEDEDDEEETDE